MKPCTSVALCALSFAVAACENSGSLSLTTLDGPAGPLDEAPPQYQDLDSTEPGTSELSGIALAEVSDFLGENREFSMRELSGELEHSTGALELTDGVYLLNDPDGADEFGLVTDGVAAFGYGGLTDESYQYVTGVGGSYPGGESSVLLTGVAGVVIRPEDVPTSGRASYRGFTEGSAEINGEFLIVDGAVQLDADFGSGRVDGTLFDFDNFDGVAKYFDRIDLENMLIDENSFGGAQLRFLMNGQDVTPLGDEAVGVVMGQFFGFDAASGLPPEIGGGVLANGEDGELRLIFVGRDDTASLPE